MGVHRHRLSTLECGIIIGGGSVSTADQKADIASVGVVDEFSEIFGKFENSRGRVVRHL